ncbi:MAG TPA: hypothetical protein VF546_13605 [Pyrinomonadaceae bacterium]|jgi:hypothetical protein
MPEQSSYRLTLKFFILCFLCLAFWVFAGRAGQQQPVDRYLPVNISEQLQTTANSALVTIRCGSAHITRDEAVELDCRLVNNTTRNITAGSVGYTITYESGGAENQEEYSSMFVSLVGGGFDGLDKTTGPREEKTVALPGPVSYAGATVVSVEAKIDYVEFDGRAGFGSNQQSIRMIQDFRAGAAKYKSWLSQKCARSGDAVSDCAPLLEREQALPAEVNLANENQQLGAKSYRNILNKRYQAGGAEEVKRLLRMR